MITSPAEERRYIPYVGKPKNPQAGRSDIFTGCTYLMSSGP